MATKDPVPALRALADPVRLGMARLLVEGAFNVGEIQEVLGLGQSTASHHLKILLDASLLICRREGRLAYYQWDQDLPAAAEALKRFVLQFAPSLDAHARQRLHTVFEARAERTRTFFSQPSAEATASERSSVTGVDVITSLMESLPRKGIVVDLGTGSGRLLGPLRDRVEQVIGVDASPVMLDRAAARGRDHEWGNIELRLGVLEHLPLRESEANSAVAHLVFHHAARPELALREVHRVLSPGGVLVVGDFLPHDREWMREELADQWLGFEPEEFHRLMEGAGFEAVKVSRYEGDRNTLGMFVAVGRKPPVSLTTTAQAPASLNGVAR